MRHGNPEYQPAFDARKAAKEKAEKSTEEKAEEPQPKVKKKND